MTEISNAEAKSIVQERGEIQRRGTTTRIAWNGSQPTAPARDANDADLCGRCGAELEFSLRGEPIQHDCCTCKGTKRVRGTSELDGPNFGKLLPCPDCTFQAARAEGESAVEASSRLGIGIPPMYSRLSFADFDRKRDATAFEMAMEYTAAWPPKPHLLTFASNAKGNGKTTLACAVLNEFARKHHVYGRFESWPDLVAEMRDASRPDATVPIEAIVERISSAEILVLDDVGVGRQTEFVDEQLYREVNKRYSVGRPLILTTNTWGKLDDRIRSRLSDRDRGKLVLFTASDARPQLPLGGAS